MTRRTARQNRRTGGAAQAQPAPTPAPVQSSPPPPPAAVAAPLVPHSTITSPTGSVLLPPVEIEISPRDSFHSSYSSSSIQQARARGTRASATTSDEEEDEEEEEEDDEDEDPDQPQGTSGNHPAEEEPGSHHKHFDRQHHYDRHHEYHPHSSQRKNRGLWSKQKVHPTGSFAATGQPQDEIETSIPRSGQVEAGAGGSGGGGGGLKKSASKGSITVKSRGCFGRMRRSPNFILFTVFLALFVDMATVSFFFFFFQK